MEIKVTHLLFLFLPALWTIESMATSPCYMEKITSLQYNNVFGTSYLNSSISFETYCLGTCNLVQMTFAAIGSAGLCFCSPAVTYTTMNSSSCNMLCADGSSCGGNNSAISTYEGSSSSSQGIQPQPPNFTCSPNENQVQALTIFSITMVPAATMSYSVVWGDGSPWSENATSHTYEVAGNYQIQVYWTNYPNLVARKMITVHEAPVISVNCTNVTAVNNPINCTVYMSTIGYDYQLSYNVSNSTSFKSLSGPIPTHRTRVIGSLIPALQQNSSLVTTTELSSGYIILGNSLLLSGGYLTRAYGRFFKTGIIEVYAATPSCSSGSYCGLSGNCSSSCSSAITPQVCSSSSTLCPVYSSCSTSDCSLGTAPSSGWTFNLLKTLSINAITFNGMNFPPVWIPEGSYLALSCKSTLCGAATLYYSQMSTVVSSLTSPDIYVGLPSTMLRRYSINLIVLEHPVINVNPVLMCVTPAPLPLNAVPKPFTAATENYLYKSSLTMNYTISSKVMPTPATQNISLICQLSILVPTFLKEIWIPVNTTYPYLINFTQGSPIFSKINVGGILVYDYYDDASLGYSLNASLIYAKVGLYTLTGNSSNLLGAVTYNSIVHVVPDVTSSWIASTNSPCYNIDYDVQLTLTLSNYKVAPWNATVTVTVMNATASMVWPSKFFDFKTFNVSGYVAPIVIQFANQTIADAGNYTLMVNISNEATNGSVNTTVVILEALRDISSVMMMDLYGQHIDGMGSDHNLFLVNLTVLFWPSARTGVASNWKTTINETGVQMVTASSVSNMTYTFLKAGNYTLMFWAYNSYQGWIASPAYPIVLLSNLDGLQISPASTAISKPGQVMSVNLNFIVFTPLTCIVIDWGDGSMDAFGYQPQCAANDPTVPYNTTVFPPVVLRHIYLLEKQYQISAKAYDAKGLFSATLSTVIADIACSLPTVKIASGSNSLSAATSVRRSMQLRLVASSSYVCNKTVPVMLTWSISQVNDTTGTPIQDLVIAGNPLVPSWNNSQLTVPTLFLSWGTYQVTFNILIKASALFNLTASDYTYVIVTKTPLFPSMFAGGASATARGFGQILVLNSTLSYDPDFYPTNGQLNVSWWCRQVSPQPGSLSPITANATSYPVVNNQSIPAPMAAANAQLTGGGCFGVGDGALINVSEIITLNTASFINPGAVYQFIMKVSNDTRVAFSTLAVTVTPYPPPNVLITCLPTICFRTNDGLIFNPQEKLMVAGNCTADCPTSPLYNWTITDENGNPMILKAPCESQPPPPNDPNYVCENALLTPTNGTVFAVSASFFTLSNPNVNTFQITFVISDKSDPTSAKGFSILTIQRNLPPANGNCTVLRTLGYALVDTFPVISGGWVDPEGLGINYYAFLISSNDTGQQVTTTIATSLQLETNLILPVGNFSLFVTAVDMLQASATFSLGRVTAIMPNQSQINAFDYLGRIAYLISIGDQTTLSMILGALSSVRDNADWLSLDQSSLTNLTSSALTDRITGIATLNNQQLKAVSTMDYATIGQLNVGANVVQQALSGIFSNKLGALTVDMDTRTTALNVLQTMAGKLSSTTAGVSDLESFMSNSMDAFSALLTGINEISTSGSNAMVPPTDEVSAQNWDYNADIGDDINQTIPGSYDEQLAANVRATTISASELQINNIYNTVRTIAYAIQGKCLPGELIQTLSPNGATIVTGRLSELALQPGYYISTNNMNASVTLPVGFCPSRYVIPNTNCNKMLGITFLVWPCISHMYPQSSGYLSPSSRTLDLEININGNIVNVTNETLPIVFNIPRDDSEDSPQIVSVNFTDSINAHQPLVYHNFQITKINSGYTLFIGPSESLPKNTILLIDHERLPTINQFLFPLLLTDFSNFNGTRSYFVDSIKNGNKTGRFFVGIGILQNDSPISNSTVLQKAGFMTNSGLSYNFRVDTSGCYFFDETSNGWSGRNVTTLNAKSSMITCSATHLTPFSTGYSLTPNTLNFDYIFANAGFTNNLLTYMTIITVSSLFVIGMVFAYLTDRADLTRVGVIPLPDNKPEDKYLYEVTFRTGPDDEALTASNIWFIASGDYGETDIRRLPCANKNLYKRFMVNSFVMATPNPLGHINFLRVFHDNSGEPPLDSWQLQMVVFRDLQTSEKSVFDTNAWLAFDRDDGKVDMTFTCSENDNINDFDQNMYNNINTMTNENNIFMSMFLRPAGSRYERKERVVVCAVFLYLSMAMSTLFYQQKFDTPRNGYFDYGLLTVSSEQLLTGTLSLLISYPATLILTFVFKRARPRQLKRCRALEAIKKQRIEQAGEEDISNEVDTGSQDTKKGKDRSPVRCIPWWTRVLAWTASIAIIAISIFIVWSYCLMWGEIKTIKWFSTFIVTFLISILVIQWLKIFILAFATTLCCKTDLSVEDIDCDEELPGLKPGEEWGHLKFMDPSVRKKVHRIEGVNYENPDIATLKTRMMKEREMHFTLRTILVYALFLTIIYILVNGRVDYNAFLLQQKLANALVFKEYDVFQSLHSAAITDDWWNWAQKIILQQLRAQRRYDNSPPYGLRGFMNDQANRMMGYAILRQIRSNRFECAVPSPVDQMIHNCAGTITFSKEDTQDFCAGWTKNETFTGACQFSEFKYQTADKTQAYTTAGSLGYYSGGGYVIRLSGLQDTVLQQIKKLQKNHWIDKNTRAVILEFSIYNANVNLFSTGIVKTEFGPDGSLIFSWRFEPVKLIKDSGTKGAITTFAEIAFVFITVFSTLKELWKIKKQKCGYLNSYWNILELLLVTISYLAIGLYFYRFVLTQNALDVFNATSGNGYVRLDAAVMVDQYYLFSLAFIIFFSTLKLIQLLQFNKRMNVLAMTIKGCWDELKIFFIAFLIVFFAFSCIFYFMFQTDILEYSNIVSSCATSFMMMLGKSNYKQMTVVNPMSPLVFFAFSLATTLFLINLMVTIILISFQEVKKSLLSMENRLNLIDHVWEQFQVAIRKKRLKNIHVTPSFKDKKDKPSFTIENKDSNNLSSKVNQLMKYVNEIYFDGQLDLTSTDAKGCLMPGSLDKPKFKSSNVSSKVSKRLVYLSDQ